jgi:formamidopyrimidine-DNA glycosylase
MPELPEVETVRLDLVGAVVGRLVRQVDVSGARVARRHRSPQELASLLAGMRIYGVRRLGKYLLVDLDRGRPDPGGARGSDGAVLVVHLGMSGRLCLVDSEEVPIEPHTHVVATFADGGQLRFVDPRTFGEMFVTAATSCLGRVPELAHLGFDPLEDHVTWSGLERRLSVRRTALKALLMDQRFVAGIGNIYADEILFRARLRYDRPSCSLTAAEVRRLHGAMKRTLSEAIVDRGSSLADEQYRDLLGSTGRYQLRHRVYGREGQPCRRCRSPIARIKMNGRSTFFCERCQV